MTDNDIVKVLECCVQYTTTDVRTYKGMLLEVFSQAVLDLINRQKEEIDYWKRNAFDGCMERGRIDKEANMSMEFIEDEIYPLTITADRYSGTYSGGDYIAWNFDAIDIPEDVNAGDEFCWDFWEKNKIVCGKGRTVSEAIADLYVKMKEGQK